MNRPSLIRRLKMLRNLEFFNIFWLPICLYVALTSRNAFQYWQPYVYGMFLICIVLAQAVLYWHLKIQTISKTGTAFPAFFYALFSFFKWADLTLLFIYPLLVFGSQFSPLLNFQTSIWANLLYLFAAIEYTNYYHYQLSHDNLNDLRYLFKYRRIRRSPLYMDLLRNQQRGRKP
ncbi:MAG: hypothetical protein RBS68_16390 [Anaerolineales bacterium]|jgi:hypothetical protein|nr:hypothetical protein [Anaerolineales bacterium]